MKIDFLPLVLLAAAALPARAAETKPKPKAPPLAALDVLAPCRDADAKTFRAWTLDEAVAHLQGCLRKAYPQAPAGAARAKAGKTRGAKALIVTLAPPLGPQDVERLEAAIRRRRGKLYGYPAVVVVQAPEPR